VKLYEYQAKAILARAGVAVPAGRVATTAHGAAEAARELGGAVVVKAQVLAGGLSKAGGIGLAADPAEAGSAAAGLLGRSLLGHPVRKVLVERRVEAQHELHLALAVDYEAAEVVFLLGRGGVEVEAHARDGGGYRAAVDPALGILPFRVREGLSQFGLPAGLAAPLHTFARRLLEVFDAHQATLVEVNPLAVTSEGLVALDARMHVDDGALERLPAVGALVREHPHEFPAEHPKLVHGFDYVEVDPEGDIGLLSTGAGLTLTVIDLIRRQGGRAFNFVDLRTGGMGRDPSRFRLVLERMTGKANLRAVLVNIFAGITNLEETADGLLAALADFPHLKGRVVVRATGTGFAAAERRWTAAGLPVIESLQEAAALADAGIPLADSPFDIPALLRARGVPPTS
jgi:succinyl-CoA synthetase beta subunit